MKRIGNLLFSVLTLVGMFFGQTAVFAQGSGLQVSPVRTEETVGAGESVTFEVQLNNVTSGTVTAQPEIYDFEPKEDGSPQIITNEENKNKAVSIKSFLSGLDKTVLAPGEKKSPKFTLTIPKGQPAGAYYGIIIFNALTGDQSQNQNAGNGGQVSLSAGVGHIVLVQVPGEITDKMQLINVTAGRKDKSGKVATGSIFSAVPTQVQITLRNTGNSILKPFGNISVDKGGKQVANIQLNNADTKASLLPNSNRVFTEELKDLKGFGRFTITVNAAYGNGGDILTQKLNIWVIPVWLGAGIGVGVLAIAVVGFLMVRKFRR